MSDPAFNLLLPLLRDRRAPALWFADENTPCAAPASLGSPEGLTVVTNRFDVHCQFTASGFDSRFTDFNSDETQTNTYEQVFYRISKERPVTHHVINRALQLLRVDGELIMCGEKDEGIKSYFDKAKKLFGVDAPLAKNGTVYLTRLQKTAAAAQGPLLDDKNYRQLRLIAEQDSIRFYSKPGVFGWDKIDRGSAFLNEYLPAFLQRHWPQNERAQNNPLPNSLLDLGCGYGYLTAMAVAALHPMNAPLRLVATDNNAAALIAARYNFQQLELPVEVIAADAGEGIAARFDLILCNPPFHQGFNVDGGLTDKFLQNTRRLLSAQGAALFVVNRFIPLERKAKTYFSRVENVAENKGFKLIGVTSH